MRALAIPWALHVDGPLSVSFALHATRAECQTYTKCHEYPAGQAVTGIDRGRPAQKARDWSRRQNQACEPNESEQRVYGAQQQDIRRHRDIVGNELRKEGDIEYTDLGIQEIRQGAGGKRSTDAFVTFPFHCEAVSWTAQHLVACPHEVGGANPSQYGVREM